MQKYIKNKTIVRLLFDNNTYHCQLIKESDTFLCVKNCFEWYFSGEYIIFVKRGAISVKYGKLAAFRNRLFWSLEQNKDEIDWIDLSSFNALFESLKNNYNKICIYGTTKKQDSFYVGKIAKYGRKYLYINEITPYGNLIKRMSRNEISKITRISFGDKYSSVLFKYAESANNATV
jgi:hypothetical protein